MGSVAVQEKESEVAARARIPAVEGEILRTQPHLVYK